MDHRLGAEQQSDSLMIKALRIFLALLFGWLFLGQHALAQTSDLSSRIISDLDRVIEQEVVDSHKFYGLAGYYNEAYFRIVRSDGALEKLAAGEYVLKEGEWLAAVGRFNVLTIQAAGLRIDMNKAGKAELLNSSILTQQAARLHVVTKPELKTLAPELGKLRYSHLIAPIRWLCLLLDRTLVLLQSVLGSWGFAIIAIALLIKIALLPLSRVVKHYQTQVSRTQTALAPRLAEIKLTLKGEAAHKAFVAAHKSQGVTTFYALKPMVGLFVQIPVWIAIFNVLAEMPQFKSQGFLWMQNLAYPDAVLNWGASIPLLGDTLNLMPIVMTVVTVASTLMFQDSDATPEALAKQKRNLFFMATAFLVLFYPFPSGMVFYWTLANILNFAAQIWRDKRAAVT